MQRFVIVLVMLWSWALPLAAADRPAGLITGVELKGLDSEKPMVLRRGNENLALKLLMPVLSGDQITLQDGASIVALELGNGEQVVVKQAPTPYLVQGEMATGDDGWDLIAALGGILGAKEEEHIPDNMVSRGVPLLMPMVVGGSKLIAADRQKLWLQWQEGKAPFRLNLEVEGAPVVIDQIMARQQEMALPQPLPKSLFVTLTDSEGGMMRFRLRSAGDVPRPPASVGNSVFAKVAWLLAQDNGKWRFEAIQMLREQVPGNQAAELLANRLASDAMP